MKLASELSKRATGRTFYILDEPTTGLHFEDIRKLLSVLERLVAAGVEPYPVGFERSHLLAAARERFGEDVSVTGRVVALRALFTIGRAAEYFRPEELEKQTGQPRSRFAAMALKEDSRSAI